MIHLEYKEKDRYKFFNTLSDNHGYFLTIIKVIDNIIYYLVDGDDEVKFFEVGSEFDFDLIKLF